MYNYEEAFLSIRRTLVLNIIDFETHRQSSDSGSVNHMHRIFMYRMLDEFTIIDSSKEFYIGFIKSAVNARLNDPNGISGCYIKDSIDLEILESILKLEREEERKEDTEDCKKM